MDMSYNRTVCIYTYLATKTEVLVLAARPGQVANLARTSSTPKRGVVCDYPSTAGLLERAKCTAQAQIFIF